MGDEAARVGNDAPRDLARPRRGGPIRMADLTTIPLRKETRDRLKRVGRKNETYDDVINRLVDLQEQLDKGARVVVPFEEVRD